MQEIALEITVILVAVLLAAFVFVVAGASKAKDLEEIAPSGYKIRNRFFVLMVIGGVLVAGLSLPRAFDAVNASAAGTNVQTITATGYQWYWEIDTEEVALDRPVEFLVTGADVTHGFGIYDEDMRLIAQTQAMPEYTNRLNVTFDKPGTYQLLCMEYCGVAHHDMVAELRVVAPGQAKNDQ